MHDAGAAAVMPLGSPIGSNRGLEMKEMIERIIEVSKLPRCYEGGDIGTKMMRQPSPASADLPDGEAYELSN